MGFNAMKLNPEYRMFDANMFLQLRATLEGIVAPTGMEMLDLSIGEPQISGGSLLTDSVAAHNGDWQFYPKVLGTPAFTDAVCGAVVAAFTSYASNAAVS